MSAAPTAELSLHFVSTYFINGVDPSADAKYRQGRHVAEVREPRSGGRAYCVFLKAKDGGGLVFDHISLRSWPVSRHSGEVYSMTRAPIVPARLATKIQERWRELSRRGEQFDYGVAAQVLVRLGAEVPTDPPPDADGGEGRRGGKELDPGRLCTVDPASKRGQVCASLHASGSVPETMARLGMGRNDVLSALYNLWKFHGMGYEVHGNAVKLVLPEGFEPLAVSTEKAGGAKPATGPVSQPKPGTKRALVARALHEGKTLEQAAEVAGCTRASAASHLHDLRRYHGIGYHIDGGRVVLEGYEG